jgi:hypothetical protein
MNCSEFERQIASDLESALLDGHLNECTACRASAGEIAANRAALQSLEIPPAALAAVRSRVLGEIRSKQRGLRWWTWPAAAAACAIFLCALFISPRFRNPGPPQPVEFAKIPHLGHWAVSKPAPPPARSQTATVATREPLVIKMLTNDPDVIIVWLVDPKGDAL